VRDGDQDESKYAFSDTRSQAQRDMRIMFKLSHDDHDGHRVIASAVSHFVSKGCRGSLTRTDPATEFRWKEVYCMQGIIN